LSSLVHVSSAPVEMAAQHLMAARRARRPGDRLPESCRPADCAGALAIQRRVMNLLGEPIGGWKCGPPLAGRINLAPITRPTIYTASPCPVFTEGPTMGIEPEVAFVLGRDLAPRTEPYSESDVRSAISETRLVLELLRGRYADLPAVSFEEKLADSLTNQGLFVGPAVDDGLARKLDAFPVAVGGVVHEGVHPAGHPLTPLVWLANYLAANADGLASGQIVTTGSYCGVLELPVGVPLCIEFGGLGVLSVELVRS
jgi:2-keto-4-pentenoate hydratase